MDPDQALEQVRTGIDRALTHENVPVQSLVEIIEGFTALDEWLSKGGHLPRAWEENRGGDRGTG